MASPLSIEEIDRIVGDNIFTAFDRITNIQLATLLQDEINRQQPERKLRAQNEKDSQWLKKLLDKQR